MNTYMVTCTHTWYDLRRLTLSIYPPAPPDLPRHPTAVWGRREGWTVRIALVLLLHNTCVQVCVIYADISSTCSMCASVCYIRRHKQHVQQGVVTYIHTCMHTHILMRTGIRYLRKHTLSSPFSGSCMHIDTHTQSHMHLINTCIHARCTHTYTYVHATAIKKMHAYMRNTFCQSSEHIHSCIYIYALQQQLTCAYLLKHIHACVTDHISERHGPHIQR